MEGQNVAKVFISYAPEDEKLVQKLSKHLKPLIRHRYIDVWDASEIRAGEVVNKELIKKIDEADIIICMLSSDFISSDHYYLEEAQYALERQGAGKVSVVPVLLKPIMWQETI